MQVSNFYKVIIVSLLLFFVTSLLIGEEALLIDFSQLTADYPADDPQLHERTIVDFSITAGTNFSDEDKQQMRVSLSVPEWMVVLNSSARNNLTQSLSYARVAQVNPDSQLFPGQEVLGVRTFFPTEPFNAYIEIKPPFEILAHSDRDEIQGDGSIFVSAEERGLGRKFDGHGVLKNVGTLRTLRSNVYGLNYPHRISVLIETNQGEEMEIPLSDLEFDGWKELEWQNPNYVDDVRLKDLRVMPLYPNLIPYIRLIGFRIYRNGTKVGGDFVSYIKDVTVTFDKALLQIERSIDDERVWGIIETRTEARRRAEIESLSQIEVLRYIERLKKHVVQDIDIIE